MSKSRGNAVYLYSLGRELAAAEDGQKVRPLHGFRFNVAQMEDGRTDIRYCPDRIRAARRRLSKWFDLRNRISDSQPTAGDELGAALVNECAGRAHELMTQGCIRDAYHLAFNELPKLLQSFGAPIERNIALVQTPFVAAVAPELTSKWAIDGKLRIPVRCAPVCEFALRLLISKRPKRARILRLDFRIFDALAAKGWLAEFTKATRVNSVFRTLDLPTGKSYQFVGSRNFEKKRLNRR